MAERKATTGRGTRTGRPSRLVKTSGEVGHDSTTGKRISAPHQRSSRRVQQRKKPQKVTFSDFETKRKNAKTVR